MWPLTGTEIVRACGALAPGHAPPSAGAVAIHGVAFEPGPPAADALFVALREDGFDGHDAAAEMLAGGVPLALVAAGWEGRAGLAPELRARCIVVEDTTRAFRLLAGELRRRFAFPVVAVGGSQGKTTTKEMLAALLSAPEDRHVTRTEGTMNGWTGIPITLTQRAHRSARPPDALVVEVGIDAVGAMASHAALVDPDLSMLTALGVEHLAGLGDLEGVVREEMLLLAGTTRPGSRRIFQLEDDAIAAAATPRPDDVLVAGPRAAARPELDRGDLSVLRYDVAPEAPETTALDVAWRPAGGAAWRRRFDVPMPGRHNADDLAIAIAAAAALGRSADEIAAGLARFVPPAMRTEVRDLPDGTVVIDDAYNANPASMRAALTLLDAPAWRARPRVAVLGDMLDLGAASSECHLALVEPLRALAAAGVRLFLVGVEMAAVHAALDGASTWLARGSDVPELEPGAVVLVKGSRGMQLEHVVAEIARRAASLHARYHARFRTVCVTGTNGKTTTTSLVAAIVAASGEPSSKVTTLGGEVAGEVTATEATATGFADTLARAAAREVRTLAIETTSEALAEGFARGWPAHVGVFTNLSRDHLDYHRTPEDYLAAKAQLFIGLVDPGGVAVLNAADPASALIDEVTPPGARRLWYAARAPDPACAAMPLALAVLPDGITIDDEGTHAALAPSPLAAALGGRLDLALVGAMHVENALAAALAAHGLGYDARAIRDGLAGFRGVPGRFEIVHRRPLVVVDYAHTPDALARTLTVARSLVAARRGRVLCVFGCGGDRDPGKREEMGAIAVAHADEVIVTNDNPRHEDPIAIACAIERGAKATEYPTPLLRLLDRASAIGHAVEGARETDIVVIAGKGHEKTQRVGDHELPFDDVAAARAALAARGNG